MAPIIKSYEYIGADQNEAMDCVVVAAQSPTSMTGCALPSFEWMKDLPLGILTLSGVLRSGSVKCLIAENVKAGMPLIIANPGGHLRMLTEIYEYDHVIYIIGTAHHDAKAGESFYIGKHNAIPRIEKDAEHQHWTVKTTVKKREGIMTKAEALKILTALDKLADTGVFVTDWEANFIESIIRALEQNHALSDSRINTLTELEKKYLSGGYHEII